MQLKVVPKTPAGAREKLRQRIVARPNPAAILQCRCGSREMLELKHGVTWKDGKPQGGDKAIVCAACWLKGERVVVAS